MTAAQGADPSLFAFVQFEFGFLIGPPDGRYLIRDEPGADPSRVVVLGTLGAPERRRLRGRRPKRIEAADPESVPTTRATLIRAHPFEAPAAAAWLEALRGDRDGLAAERDEGLRALNHVIRAHRAAAADVHARDLAAGQALVIRVGFGRGEQVADGRYADALELPRGSRRATRDERIAPQERLAALLGARERQLVCEELVLRARADIDAARPREAALEARVALEAAVAELAEAGGAAGAAELGELRGLRGAVGKAANAALAGDPPAELAADVERAVDLMERVLRRYRAAGAASDFSGS